MSLLFGVDFGTTTTAFVAFDQDVSRYEKIGDEEGRPFHSVIVLDSIEGNVTHRGARAWERRQLLSADTESIVISSIKQKLCSHDRWRAGNRIWTPEMVASEVLKNGTQVIRERWPDVAFPIEAVVAVPVDFEYEERCKIIEAADRAGIQVKQIVSEPTAALVGSGEDLSRVQHAVVFDWGGGTLDVSVLRNSNGRMEELEKKGIRIGGDDLDELFANYLHFEHRKLHPEISSFDQMNPRQKDRILTLSERHKRNLSYTPEQDVVLPDYAGALLEEPIDRPTFEEIIEQRVSQVIETTNVAITEAGLSTNDVDLVLLVGGSSQIPLIKRRMDELFGARCVFPQHADWCIANGAARLARELGSYTLSKSVGLVLSDGSFLPVIRRGQPIDHQAKQVSLGLVEDSREARVIIAESFAERIGQVEHRVIEVLLIPTQGYNFEPVEVTFEIQTDLALKISACGRIGGKENQTQTIYPHLKFQYQLGEYE